MRGEILLGAAQGTLEWLPVSSQGFGLLAAKALGTGPAFETVLWLHLGTLIAAFLYFRNDLPGEFSFLAEATLASAVTGFPAYLLADSLAGGWPNLLIGSLLISIGLAQGRFKINLSPSVASGLAQGLAVIPGVSRSAVTVLALTATGLRKEEALKKSFLMSIPAILALTFARVAILGSSPPPVLGIATAAAVGYLTLPTLLSLAREVSFRLFSLSFGLLAVLSTLL